MTDDLRFERQARDWLELGPTRAPSDGVAAALLEIETTPQDRHRAVSWRVPVAVRSTVAAAVGVVVLAIGVGLSVIGGPVLLPANTQLQPASAIITITPTWPADDRIALTARGAGVDAVTYWRGATYDRIEPHGWTQTDTVSLRRPAGASLLAGTLDDPAARPGTQAVDVTITPEAGGAPLLISPGLPITVDRPVELTLLGPGGGVGSVAPDDPGSVRSYRITGTVPVRGADADEIEAAALRAAGTDYPAEVSDRYLELDRGILGPRATALRNEVVTTAGSRSPYDLAVAAEAVLRSPDFSYSADVSDLACDDVSIPECLATYRRGYCLYYATTMAAILRDLGVPARLVQGFLPGPVTGGVEVVPARNAHAWVEAYFPRHGWVTFDPTPRPLPDQVAPTR